MCGIAGLVGQPDADVIERLSDGMAHRGPDGQGAYRNGPCALVHTRLAIVDLKTGDQPFVEYSDDGAEVALIANGEIYNNLELRERLPDVTFKTRSDCEPPLHLYLKYGLDFVDLLRGMYAIAIWDSAKQSLVLSRDPFGIKPLYYATTSRGFAFASEPAVLVAAGLVEAKLNTDKRDELLQLQFTTGQDLAFQGIHRVLPGESLRIEGGEIVERRIRAALPSAGVRNIPEAQALKELDDVMTYSVGVHQRSDVPYGMFLSGGIDSSALLAMMKRMNSEPVLAFTAGFSGTAVADERELARTLAKSQGAKHIEIDFGADDFWASLPGVVKHMDDPVADYAVLPTWKLAEKARAEGIKVVLAGEGGDELFAGYGRYRTANRWLLSKDMYRKGILDGLGVLRNEDASQAWRSGMVQAKQETRQTGRTKLQNVQAQDIQTWLPCDLLVKLDRMLMAHGVEGRVPFVDMEMAKFAFALPDNLKIKDGLGKHILRQWLNTALPAAKPFAKKRGFTVPVGAWIANDGVRAGQLVAEQDCIASICKPDVVKDLFKHSEGRAAKAAWTLLFYALWHKIHMDGVLPEGQALDVLSA
ncbi:MAG: asparagine synthase (glutamine-hydrolyzing) [Rhodospirillaceae bacterium]|nr:MAG: asparagine synthase (glutamine-hydrolyzing) [Rhodospirillaceae bacterium]